MRQMAMGIGAPDATWSPPTSLPDKLVGPIGLDTETRDDGLGAGLGPGWAWGGGYLVGVSLCADNWSGYLPVAHEGGGNLDPNLIRRFLGDVLSTDQLKIGANLMYDVGWLRDFGVDVAGPFYDVQWAEALIDEHRRSYSLDSIAKDRVGKGKNEDALRDAARAWGLDPKGELWRLPSRYVGAYAEDDAVLPRLIRDVQRPFIDADDAWGVLEMEHALLPLYVEMRMRGIRVDEDHVMQLDRDWSTRRDNAVDRIRVATGQRVDIWAPESVARALSEVGVEAPLTKKTKKRSVTKGWLESVDHPAARAVLEARSYDKLVGTFLRGQIQGHIKRGRIHAEFHPLKSDDGGTVGGRGSMTRPNLQFMPARTKEGLEIRRCFLPEDGSEWASADYSQQEPRLLVHFASQVRRRGKPLTGVEEAVRRYVEDRKANYHRIVADLTGLDYKAAKILNLAIIYGQGVRSVADQLDATRAEVEDLMTKHRAALPFATEMSKIAAERVESSGKIRTLLGRTCHFPYWESAKWSDGDPELASSKKEAIARFGPRVRRAWGRKGLNRLVQGSAADQTKAAMLAVYEAGYGPMIAVQVHDELCLSSGTRDDAYRIAKIMEDAVELRVPSVVDVDFGPTWGHASEG